jgi:hypothetical protein
MAAHTFTQTIKYISSKSTIAIKQTADEAQQELKKCILEQYYQDPGFYPNMYERTNTFLNSALSTMLSNTTAKIYIDVEGMHYKNGFSPEKVVSWAAESKHGAEYLQTSTEPFWERFVMWCDENLLLILKKNLKKNGVPVI